MLVLRLLGSCIRYDMIAFMSTTTSIPSTHWFLFLFLFQFLLIRDAWSLGIDFTVPAGGATWPAGPLTVQWTDAGGYPDESDLVAYTLELVVGGNSPDNSEVLQSIGRPNGTIADGEVEDEVSANIAQSIQNGFYLKMTLNTTKGDQVINYSQRFTLISMKGTTDSVYLEGANAAAGDSANVPEAQYNAIQSPASTITPPGTASPPPNPSATAPPIVPSGEDDDDNVTSGMDKGTMAGLITGGILALIGFVSLFIWVAFFWRRIKQKREERKHGKEEQEQIIHKHITPTFIGHKAELAAHRTSGLHFPHTRQLSPQDERFEMNGLDKIAEVPASPMVYELEGSWDGWEASSGRKSKAYDPTL